MKGVTRETSLSRADLRRGASRCARLRLVSLNCFPYTVLTFRKPPRAPCHGPGPKRPTSLHGHSLTASGWPFREMPRCTDVEKNKTFTLRGCREPPTCSLNTESVDTVGSPPGRKRPLSAEDKARSRRSPRGVSLEGLVGLGRTAHVHAETQG